MGDSYVPSIPPGAQALGGMFFMAGFTPNYQLHQWEPTDNFLRTDFNQDFEKIDTALGEAESQAGQAVAALEPMSFNLYNLMLQNDYDGKYTGYKKALIFDGFADSEGIASLEGGFVHFPEQKQIMLDAVGQGTADVNYGRTYKVGVSNQTTRNVTWTAQGRGTLTAVSIRVADAFSGVPFRITLYENESEVSAGEGSVSSGTENTVYTVTLDRPLTLEKGRTFRIEAWQSDEYGYLWVYSSHSEQLGCRLEITSLGVPTGKLTGTAQESSVTATRALAWVRHSGGTVGLSLNGAAMTAREVRNTQDLEGHICTEQAFSLDGPITSPITPVLTMESSVEAWLYDYGIVLL